MPEQTAAARLQDELLEHQRELLDRGLWAQSNMVGLLAEIAGGLGVLGSSIPYGEVTASRAPARQLLAAAEELVDGLAGIESFG